MTNQEGVHAAVRAETGTSGSYLSDWHALFDADGIAAGPWNGRLLAWINQTLGTSYAELNTAMNAFAQDQGFERWGDMNTLVLAAAGAAELLSEWGPDGLALDFTDDFHFATTGFYGSAAIAGGGTQDGYNSSPTQAASSLLSFTSTPSPKLTRGPNGAYRYQAHNLYALSEAPANQSITVVSGATYAITITGTVSVTASGAATGTWTAGTTTFTAATTTLTLGSTSGSGTVHVRRTPSDSTYLKTDATYTAPRYALPFEWDSNGVLEGLRRGPQATNVLFYSRDATQIARWQNAGVGNATLAKTATGIDGVANSGSKMTAANNFDGVHAAISIGQSRTLVTSGASGAFTVGEVVTTAGGARGLVTAWSSPNLTVMPVVSTAFSGTITGASSGTTATYVSGDPGVYTSSIFARRGNSGTGAVRMFNGTTTGSELTGGAGNTAAGFTVLNGATITDSSGYVQVATAAAQTYGGSFAISTVAGRAYKVSGWCDTTGDGCRLAFGSTSTTANRTTSGTGALFLIFVANASTTYVFVGTAAVNTTARVRSIEVYELQSQEITLPASNAPHGRFSLSGNIVLASTGLVTATATDVIDVDVAQCELGDVATSPIETFNGSATRAADNFGIATSVYPHSATVGTAMIEYVPDYVSSAMVALRLDDNTTNEVISIGHDASANIGLTVTDGGAAQTGPLTSGTATAGAVERIAVSWKANDFLLSDNGNTAVADTSGTLPTVTSLDLGPTLSGQIKRIVLVPYERSAAEVEALAAAE